MYSSAEDALTALVERTCRKRAANPDQRLQSALKQRNITSIELVSDLVPDGVLEPLGSTFEEGFRVLLSRKAPAGRTRFTIAHEVCHTFFYEFVPEMKFQPHDSDETEERLCNIGAAALLIPGRRLRVSTRGLPVCLDSLERLAKIYSVSIPTMLLRLRTAGLWKCELSTWYRTANGTFTLDRLYGGPRARWNWVDDAPLREAWGRGRTTSGVAMLYVQNATGARRYRPIIYQTRRSGSGVLVLWGKGINILKRSRPLFDF
jgi:hypothetical protein